MTKVTCQIESYDEPKKPSVFVKSHWNSPKFVHIEFDGKEVTVSATDLIEAIKNAVNTNRYG